MARKSGSITASTLVVAASLCIGGACGSLMRLTLSALQPADAAWPFMTMAINLTGAVFLGFITAYMAQLGPDIGLWRVTRLGLGTGLIGGYTTYSTFMLEVAKHIKSGHVGVALSYLLGSIIFGLLCALLGLAIGKAAGKRRIQRNALVSGNVARHENLSGGADGRGGVSASSVSAAPEDLAEEVGGVKNGESTAPAGSAGQEPVEPKRGPLVSVAFILFLCVVLVALLVNHRHWQNVATFGLLIAASLIGGLGAFTRYSVDAWVNNRVHLPFPCGTIVVNLSASLAMGLVAGWCATHAGLTVLQYLLASGFLGGYSTFSTASVEGAKLVSGGKPLWAFVHTAGMMAASLALLLLGMLV
ncbi:CrcB family protein [Bifidobacterium sp. ESL0728]|uniref:fluoride efflux transporter FluC n=1 Tax=Bifidobacterium sp. ESL0728 TaxID=2983220 RepID=UPI0023F879E4|nr:CrcB family protein [Bifidobacterium sp. ESL0728]WEV58603.1 CrcB family protein [Bifidobacterium sp. ESL0728]